MLPCCDAAADSDASASAAAGCGCAAAALLVLETDRLSLKSAGMALGWPLAAEARSLSAIFSLCLAAACCLLPRRVKTTAACVLLWSIARAIERAVWMFKK